MPGIGVRSIAQDIVADEFAEREIRADALACDRAYETAERPNQRIRAALENTASWFGPWRALRPSLRAPRALRGPPRFRARS